MCSKFIVMRRMNFAALEIQNRRAGVSHQDRRVGGDDELAVLGDHVFDGGDERQLANRRERGFGFIK